MKKLVLFALLIMATAIQAQTMKHGSITFEMDVESDDPEVKKQMAMMNMEMKVTMLNDLSRTDINMMGGMISMVTIMDNKEQEGILLVDGMGQKKAAIMSKSDLKEMIEKQSKEQDNLKIKATDKYETIAGFKCRKYLVEMPTSDNPMEIYSTEAIKIQNSQFQNQFSKGVKGFPLKIVINGIQGQDMEMTIMATDVDKKKPSKELFDTTIPEDYEKTTMEELGGGNMGF